MTTVTVSGTVSGYSLNSPVTELSITASGYINGPGVSASTGAYTIVNLGRVESTTLDGDGIYLHGGGLVTNGGPGQFGARISGYSLGVRLGASGTVQNYATIANTTTAFVNSAAVYIAAAGLVTNGAGSDTVALIEGNQGVEFTGAAGTVDNYGTILATGIHQSSGLYMKGGGSLTNGAAGDTTALVSGGEAVVARGAMTVANFGSIISTNGYTALNLYAGGQIANGSAFDTGALIRGYRGVSAMTTATVRNFGSIEGNGTYGEGVLLEGGGVVVNGSATDRSALIEGNIGVGGYGGAISTVTNAGTILGFGAGEFGVSIDSGGALTNGAKNNTTALVQGYGGAKLYDGASGSNFGTIQGLGEGISGSGLLLDGAGVTNGGGVDTRATIEGYYGVDGVNGANTVTNYGTIAGASGVSVVLDGYSTLIIDASSAFVGVVNGNSGTLSIGSGVGTVTDVYGAITFTDATPTVGMYNFNALDIAGAAQVTLAGTGSLGPSDLLKIEGALSAAGTINVNGGAFTESGALTGTGELALENGAGAIFNNGTSLTIAKVVESGSATLASFDTTLLTLSDVWTQTGGTLQVGTGDKVVFTGAGDVFGGTLAGTGTIDFTAGSDALTGIHITATSVVVTGATVTLAGSISLSHTVVVTSPNLTIAAAGASLTSVGELEFSNTATNAIHGGALTNAAKIVGAGLVSVSSLTNSAFIDANFTNGLTLTSGSGTVTNSGTIESTSTGGLTITGALNNTGTLTVTNGFLVVDGAVTGTGVVKIVGGTADFGSTFTENVSFSSTTGVLELAKSQTYTGQVTGLSTTGKSSLDLLDIIFGGTTKATFSGTTTSGTLTVTDGTHTSKITLEGNYVGHTFTTSSDGHGGTTVVDPAVPNGGGHIAPLVSAMAGFGGDSSAGLISAPRNDATRFALLAAPA